MTQYEVGQKVWVPMVVSEIEPEGGCGLDLKLRLDDGIGDTNCVWISSKHPEVLTEAPPQPKPPIPVRLFGHTIFDLANCVHITNVVHNENSDKETKYTVVLCILRGEREESTYLFFHTKEEAKAARILIEKEVLKAKGIDDGQKDNG